MSLDVPTDIDERGANYHAWCVVCRLRETVCTCFDISNGQLRGRCESVPHSAAVPCLAEAQHKLEQGKRQQDTWARGCRAWPNCGCGSLRSCQWREIRRRETERDRPDRPAPEARNRHFSERGCGLTVSKGSHLPVNVWLAPAPYESKREHDSSCWVGSGCIQRQAIWRIEPCAKVRGDRSDQPGKVAGTEHRFPPRTPASPCRSERHCGDPSNGLWRDCCDSSRGRGFFQ